MFYHREGFFIYDSLNPPLERHSIDNKHVIRSINFPV